MLQMMLQHKCSIIGEKVVIVFKQSAVAYFGNASKRCNQPWPFRAFD